MPTGILRDRHGLRQTDTTDETTPAGRRATPDAQTGSTARIAGLLRWKLLRRARMEDITAQNIAAELCWRCRVASTAPSLPHLMSIVL